ncbi:phage tail protein [Chitinophaga ginsengisoli]|uniref:Phage tail-like protein n=1 Tax=Chitinophaga ginsengisoli TaxID=363837 RepID=A0A2P8GM96_9BACT|nr:phage tail protein [Chitinophaga ginsengisoli]PSL35066.1 phage tail-like protein [Chitinophaga ginsengisoli]
MATANYPPVGFHFKVEFLFDKRVENDILFQSVSGLNFQMQTDTLREGGENRFEHVIPMRNKCTDLVLRRGIFKPGESTVSQWCLDAFKNFSFSPIDLIITLLNEQHQPLMTWKVHRAWPKNWKVADFNADKGEVVIETFELNYNYFNVE